MHADVTITVSLKEDGREVARSIHKARSGSFALEDESPSISRRIGIALNLAKKHVTAQVEAIFASLNT